MPSPEEVAWARFRVATMIGCATGIVSVLVYLKLGGIEVFRPSATVYVYLNDLSGVEKSSAVQFNGIHVGEVSHTSLSGLHDPRRAVRLDMVIRNEYLEAIPENSTVEITAQNLLDEQFVNINEGKSPRHLMPGGELRASPPPAINPAQMLEGGKQILAQLDAVVRDMETGHGNVGSLVKSEEMYNSILGKVRTFQQGIQSVSARNTVAGQLLFDESSYNRIEAPVKRLDHALAEIESGRGVAGRLLQDPSQYERIQRSVAKLNRELTNINSGKTSGRKLLYDDATYRRLVQILNDLQAEVEALNMGEGAFGQLMVSSGLYESLEGGTRNLQQMIRAIRENPKKMLRPKLF